MYRPKDFIATASGLLFAVVDPTPEADKILCCLRYVPDGQGHRKVNTEQAHAFLNASYPEYFWYSRRLDARLHAVPLTAITTHFQPRVRLQSLLANPQPTCVVERDCYRFCGLLQQHAIPMDSLGLTGSLLPSVQHALSDIDLVCYDRSVFKRLRQALRELIRDGHCATLAHKDWEDAYQRRRCELSLSEYIWHERRKLNKVMFAGRKIDVSLQAERDAKETVVQYKKTGPVKLLARIVDDAEAFDSPALWQIDHARIDAVVSFTPTYTGQASTGECVEVKGILEQDSNGRSRIVIGSSREAAGEYIKVVGDAEHIQ